MVCGVKIGWDMGGRKKGARVLGRRSGAEICLGLSEFVLTDLASPGSFPLQS